MSLQLKTDFSYLFGSTNSTSNSSVLSTNWLSDYASIKNGSYSKLMKAYYGGSSTASSMVSSSLSTSKDSSKTISSIQSSTDALKEASDELLSKSSKSVFSSGDTDKIFSAVSKFIDQYNSVIDSAEDSETSGIQNRVNTLVNMTNANAKLLGNVGISINKDHTLSIDETSFKAAKQTTIKELFHSTGSYAYQVSAQASLLNYAATNEASKSNTYNSNATYGNNYSSGDLFSYYS